MNNQNNEPAFPYAFEFRNDSGISLGMTLRDYFAAKALAGIMADPHRPNQIFEKSVAALSYLIADLMLKARKQ